MVGDIAAILLWLTVAAWISYQLWENRARPHRWVCRYCGRPIDVRDAFVVEHIPFCSMRCSERDHLVNTDTPTPRRHHGK